MANRVILGSDDDFDDVSDACGGDVLSRISSGESVKAPLSPEFVNDHRPAPNHYSKKSTSSSEAVRHAMQYAHEGLFELVPGLNVRDFTADMSCDGAIQSSKLKRSRTTMEQLGSSSSKSRTTCSKHSLDDLGLQQVVPDETWTKGLSPKRQKQDDPSTKPARSTPNQTFENWNHDLLPSSREIFAAGSGGPTEPTPEQTFHTQSTMPFTFSGNSHVSPMVFVPSINLQSSNRETRSSGVLAGQINDITDFPEQDIANGITGTNGLGQSSASTGPPTVVPVLLEGAAIAGDTTTGEGHNSTAVSQAPMLDEVLAEAGKAPAQEAKKLPLPEGGAAAKETSGSIKKPKARSSDHIDPDSDELSLGLPREMYQPRPSRSRAKRAIDDLSISTSAKTMRATEDKGKKGKRRKTAGDVLEEPIDLDGLPSPLPNKSEKKRNKSDSSVKDDPEGEMAHLGADSAGIKSKASRRLPGGDCIELGDALEAEEVPAIEPASKKKRGKPKRQVTAGSAVDKSSQQVQIASPVPEAPADVQVATEEPDEAAGPGNAASAASIGMAGSTATVSKLAKKRGRPQVHDESEDELAGDHRSNEPTVEQPNKESEPPTTKSSKRGRKPGKSAQAVVEEARQDEETTQTIETSRVDEQPSEPQRSPLKDKTNSGNVPLIAQETVIEEPTKSPEKEPQTPQKQVDKARSKHSPLQSGKVPYRVGLSRCIRIEPLLKVVRR